MLPKRLPLISRILVFALLCFVLVAQSTWAQTDEGNTSLDDAEKLIKESVEAGVGIAVEMKDQVEEASEETLATVEDGLGEAKEKIDDELKEAKEAVEDGLKEAKEATEEAVQDGLKAAKDAMNVEDIVEGSKEDVEETIQETVELAQEAVKTTEEAKEVLAESKREDDADNLVTKFINKGKAFISSIKKSNAKKITAVALGAWGATVVVGWLGSGSRAPDTGSERVMRKQK